MAQSLSKILLHIVFSTKNRERTITPQIRNDLHAYIAGICRDMKAEAFRVGGTSDHVHLLCSLPRTQTVSNLIEDVKKISSKWMKQQNNSFPDFSWQSGYGAFSLGQSQFSSIVNYIENQETHHKKISFQEELLTLLNKYQIEYDEKYLWC